MRLSQNSRSQGTKEMVKFRRPQNAGHFLGTVWALMPNPSFVPGCRKGSAPCTWADPLLFDETTNRGDLRVVSS